MYLDLLVLINAGPYSELIHDTAQGKSGSIMQKSSGKTILNLMVAEGHHHQIHQGKQEHTFPWTILTPHQLKYVCS